MWPFSSDDDGCGAHHFDEWKPFGTPKFEIESGAEFKFEDGEKVWFYWDRIYIQRSHSRDCLHDGCDEEEQELRTVEKISVGEDSVSYDELTDVVTEALEDEYGGDE